MKYYKRVWFLNHPVYYRVYPDGRYEWCDLFRKGEWYRESLPTDNWIQYLNLCRYYPKPFEVSELEVLVVLGPEAVREV